MANQTITLNSGAGGSKLAMDENASNEFYQRVKLVDGTDDSDTIIAAGNGANGSALLVTVANDSTGQIKLAAGTALVGTVNLGTFASTAATSPAKLEDQASANGDMGMALLARRTASPADTSGTDLDYEMLQMDNGRLWTSSQGGVAHDAVDSENPLKLGAKAKSPDGTSLGLVAENDRTDLHADLNGRLMVSTAPAELTKATDNQSTAQTDTALLSAPGAAKALFITDIVISANGAANTVKFVEDTGGTPADVVSVIYVSADAPFSMHFNTPLKITTNKDFGYTSTVANNHSITVSGYVADV